MTGDVFVDTNVLVYTRDASEPVKQPLAAAWMTYLWQSRRGRLSIQVLNEYYYTVTRKLRPGLGAAEARQDVRDLTAWGPLPLRVATLQGAWLLQDRHALSLWDALIIAAAQAGQCRYVLSEDLQDGQNLAGVVVLNPFTHTPSSIAQT